jgi:hypothetical protein
MTNRLLDRQAILIEYLTSTAVLFGEEANAPDPALRGIDRGLLRLEARFCCNRRIKKIVATFPRSFEILGADQSLILRKFIEGNPQTASGTLANARQFYQFVSAHWRREPPKLPYLPDVTACEFAIVIVGNISEDIEKSFKICRTDGPKPAIRRHRTVLPLRCAYDIRSVVEVGLGEIVPTKRDTLLIVTSPSEFGNARIIEVPPIVFDLLIRLDDWVDPMRLGAMDDLGCLISSLEAQRLIEVWA